MATASNRYLAALIGGTFLLVSLLVLVGSTIRVFVQAHRLATAVPVPARILESYLIARSGKTRTYTPFISFTYRVGTRSEIASTPLVLMTWSSSAWAQELVDRYRPGMRVTAYRSPVEPDQAFLIHEVSFTPYQTMMVSVAVLALALLALVPSRLGAWDRRHGLTVVTVLADVVVVFSYVHFMWSGGRLRWYPLLTLVPVAISCIWLTTVLVLERCRPDRVSGSVEEVPGDTT